MILGEKMAKSIEEICKKLGVKGEIVEYSQLSDGHINSTFKVGVLLNGKKKSYIIQKINTDVFKNPKTLMKNILAITKFLKDKQEQGDSITTLDFLKGQGHTGFVDTELGCFRGYEYVPNSKTFNITDDQDLIFETGYAFGEFQKSLGDFPAGILFETIPDFHNTPKRFWDFEQAINNNYANRASDEKVAKAIKEYLKLRNIASMMYNKYRVGELPERVTHNDTKCNNVLFDKRTQKHICVIDLDTVMPGLAGFDFGDGIRSIANSAPEDEKDLNKVELDLRKFESFTKGFLSGAGDVFTKEEIDTLPLGAITMTVECGVRFLTDYLNGDTYFKTRYAGQNLDRALCQLKLAQDMVAKRSVMSQIVMDSYQNLQMNK